MRRRRAKRRSEAVNTFATSVAGMSESDIRVFLLYLACRHAPARNLLKFSGHLSLVVSYPATHWWRIKATTIVGTNCLVFPCDGMSMHRDGRYAAWFRTPRGEGTGVVNLANGRITGGDSFFTYSGSYQIAEDRFTAALKTKRYAEGPPTLFGIDEVEVELAGTFNGRMATCAGMARQAPGLSFAATLIASEDASPEADGSRADKLPVGPDSRYRVWKPAMRGLSRA